MFSLNDFYSTCSLFVVLCTTALAAPGGLGSFAGSSAVAFSSANANAQAGSVANAASSAHAVSSANAFVGGFAHDGSISSNNKDGVNHEIAHQPNIFAGTGSYVGYGSHKPDSNKFGLMHHQVSGNHKDNKSGTPCSLCQNTEGKWDKGERWDYDEHSEETEEESEQPEESDDSHDDGQYRPEHHYYEDLNKKHKQQTVSGIHKIEDDHPYHYNQASVGGGHTGINSKNQENANDKNYYGNIETPRGHGSKLNNNAESTQSQIQDSSHLASSWTNLNKQKENGHADAGISGSVVTPDLSGTSGIGAGQGPVKLDQSDIVQIPNVPALEIDNFPNADNTQNKPHFPDKQNTGQWIGAGNKPSSFDQHSTGQWPGAANKPSLDQQSTGQWSGAGNKPSLDQQNTGQWPGAGNKPSLDQQSTGLWPGAGNKPSVDQQSTGQWPGAGNKPSSFDQQSTGQWPGAANKPSLDQQSTGQWSGAGNKPSLDQQNTGQWPGAGNKPSSFDQQSTGLWPGAANKPSLDQQSTGQWSGAGNKPSLDQQNTGQWLSPGNKPPSLNQPSTGHSGNHGSTNVPDCASGESLISHPSDGSTLQKNLPIATQTYGGVSGGASYSDKNNAGTRQNVYGGATDHGDIFYPGDRKDSHIIGTSAPSIGQAGNIGSLFPHGLETTAFPQNGIGIKPAGSGNCGAFSGSSCTNGAGYPGNTGPTGIQIGQNIHGQMHTDYIGDGHVDQNVYKVNAENPFLYDVQGPVQPLIHTTSSPIQVPSHTEVTTSKPIGLGNPFLDGTLEISNTYGTHSVNTDKSDHNKVETSTETLSKPIGTGNPFLTHGHENGHENEHGHGHGHAHAHGHGHSKGDSPIYNIGIAIGGSQPTSTTPWTTTTVKPVGIDNPFFHPSGGNIMQQQSHNEHSDVIQENKHVLTESGITHPVRPLISGPIDKDSVYFPAVKNVDVGVTPSGIHHNINSGVKGGAHHNKEYGSTANTDAGVSAIGHDNIPSIPGIHNGYNNVGPDSSSLTGNANKPINSLSNIPGAYDYKATPQTSGHGGSVNDKGTYESNALINGNNANNQYKPNVANGAALSLATANADTDANGHAGGHAGSYSSSFSSSQASSSSFAASQSASYSASGDLSSIMPQMKGTWPLDIARNMNINSTWSNATSQASSFAANSSGRWSGSHPVAVKGR